MPEMYLNTAYSADERAKDLLQRLSVEAKIGQMCQIDGRENPETWITERNVGSMLHVRGNKAVELQRIAEKSGYGIPVLFGIDAIHGHAFEDGATVFPTQLALASSWDTDLLEKVGTVTAKEVSATGIHLTFSPVLGIARDLRWGRIGETFGEDPFLAGELGTALIRGYQGERLDDAEHILACAKHFAGYCETEGGRDSAEADISERKFRSLFLPPFRRAVKEGCGSVMAGYQALNGVPCSANKWLLNSVLKKEWGFSGIVISDYDNIGRLNREQFICSSIEEAVISGVESGNDMIMATPEFYDTAIRLVKEGRLNEGLIDEACFRILRLKFKMGLFDHKRYPKENSYTCIASGEHLELTRKAAEESMVLLKNDNNVLPLKRDTGKIAVIGPNADNRVSQLGDWSLGADAQAARRSSDYHSSTTVTVLQGLREYFGSEHILYAKGCSLEGAGNNNSENTDGGTDTVEEAVLTAEKADAVVAVLGDSLQQNGEMHDRANLDITGRQAELLSRLSALGKPLILVLINGKPLTIPLQVKEADAVLEAWNPGIEGGRAVASILSGETAPSGKLPISFPHHVGQQPVYYNQTPGWHAEKYYDMPAEPLFSFGYGLTYTSFSFANLHLSETVIPADGSVTVSIDVENIGDRAGTEVVQFYVTDVYSSVATPQQELKAFRRVYLEPGRRECVQVTLNVDNLALVDAECKSRVEPGEFVVRVGFSSNNKDQLHATFTVQ